MKKTILSAMVILGLVALVIGCGNKYSDVVETNKDFIALMSDYVDDVANVASAGDAAKAINKLADGMEKLVPKMKELSEKYPELKDHENIPEEIKAMEKDMEDVGRRFGESFMKLMPYMADKDVQSAQARLSTTMSGLGPNK
jgi:hypothetical protein